MAILKLVAGDIIAVPSQNDGVYGFVLARVIRRIIWHTIEVFSEFHTDYSMTADDVVRMNLGIKDRLFDPVGAVFLFSKLTGATKWPVLMHNPDYDPERDSRFSEIIWLCSEYEEDGMYLKGDEEFFDDCHDRIAEDRTIWQTHQLVLRVKYYMDGIYKKGEVFDLCKIERELMKTGQLHNRTNEAIEISEIVAKNFIAERKKVATRIPYTRKP
jgi:hypothetical protein